MNEENVGQWRVVPPDPGPRVSRNPEFRNAVRDTFAEQAAMRLLGAEVGQVEAGEVEIYLPIRPDLTQQHGVVHGGVIAMVLDAACAFSVASLLPAGHTGFTVNLNVDYLAGAAGEELVARGEVVRVGRALAVARGAAYAVSDGHATPAAVASSVLQHFPANRS